VPTYSNQIDEYRVQIPESEFLKLTAKATHDKSIVILAHSDLEILDTTIISNSYEAALGLPEVYHSDLLLEIII
jgi:hypothetical protein